MSQSARARRRGLGRAGVPTKVDPTTRCKVCGEGFNWCTCDDCDECGNPRGSDECECDDR